MQIVEYTRILRPRKEKIFLLVILINHLEGKNRWKDYIPELGLFNYFVHNYFGNNYGIIHGIKNTLPVGVHFEYKEITLFELLERIYI